MKYFLIAGERSGDLHGANLIKALKKEDPGAEFSGWGGDQMENAGMKLLVHYKRLAFMGLVEVIKNYFTIRKMFRLCHDKIRETTPDVIILIDYGGFNLRIARFASVNGFKVYYYISPKLWAWNTKRALKVKKYVDRMFVILPFETDFYKRFDYYVDYVGNPVVDAVKNHTPKVEYSNTDGDKIIALLPGSRRQEVRSLLPIMVKAAKMSPDYQFKVAAVDTIDQHLYDVIEEAENVTLVYEKTYDLLNKSCAAIVTSGTATLETALFNVPQVVVYHVASMLTYFVGRMLVDVKFMSLVNLIADEEVVTELLQSECTASNINSEIRKLIDDPHIRNNVFAGYDKVRKKLGDHPVSETVARKMYSYLSDH